MNERIKEQALIASEYAMKSLRALNGGDQAKQLQTYLDAYNAKFAELIVRKCIDIIHPYEDDDHYIEKLIERDVRKYFGVEE